MEDVAHKITERLYGDDEIKCEFIGHWGLNNIKKIFDILDGTKKEFKKFIESISEGRMDEYMMGAVEFFEEYFYFEKMVNDMHNGIIIFTQDNYA